MGFENGGVDYQTSLMACELLVLRGQRGQLFLFSMQIEDVIPAYIMKVKKDVLMS